MFLYKRVLGLVADGKISPEMVKRWGKQRRWKGDSFPDPLREISNQRDALNAAETALVASFWGIIGGLAAFILTFFLAPNPKFLFVLSAIVVMSSLTIGVLVFGLIHHWQKKIGLPDFFHSMMRLRKLIVNWDPSLAEGPISEDDLPRYTDFALQKLVAELCEAEKGGLNSPHAKKARKCWKDEYKFVRTEFGLGALDEVVYFHRHAEYLLARAGLNV